MNGVLDQPPKVTVAGADRRRDGLRLIPDLSAEPLPRSHRGFALNKSIPKDWFDYRGLRIVFLMSKH